MASIPLVSSLNGAVSLGVLGFSLFPAFAFLDLEAVLGLGVSSCWGETGEATARPLLVRRPASSSSAVDRGVGGEPGKMACPPFPAVSTGPPRSTPVNTHWICTCLAILIKSRSLMESILGTRQSFLLSTLRRYHQRIVYPVQIHRRPDPSRVLGAGEDGRVLSGLVNRTPSRRHWDHHIEACGRHCIALNDGTQIASQG